MNKEHTAHDELSSKRILVSLVKVKKYFSDGWRSLLSGSSKVRAVDGVSIDIRAGESFGLVGESGCGKSTLGRVILGLHKASSGNVLYKDDDIYNLIRNNRKAFRRQIQMIFQDPSSSLNPRKKIGRIMADPFVIHHPELSGKAVRRKSAALLEEVGLSAYHLDRYPHELSGGQKQRVGIARAMALGPEMIVCDEPVSALDVSIQAQVINLLDRLQKKFNLTLLFISHDLNVVHHLSDRIGVMYLGKIVEIAPRNRLYHQPAHPYTHALLSAIPISDPDEQKQRILLKGDLPSPSDPPAGCRFHTRCPEVLDICSQLEPQLVSVAADHYAACHLSHDNRGDRSIVH
ncbi:MAG: ATP-binding cassette domain-containing protein [Desulfobacteraceae bacterium]|nr:ATP-binding cassette domain-containing protein [Desulfobacteraceae bacterium]